MRFISITGGQTVRMGPDILICVVKNKGGTVTLGIESPRELYPVRGERKRRNDPFPPRLEPVWDPVQKCYFVPKVQTAAEVKNG